MKSKAKKKIDKYVLSPRFERAAAAMIVARPNVWKTIGRLLKQDSMPSRDGELIVMLARLAAGEGNGTPGGFAVIYQVAEVLSSEGGKEAVELAEALAWAENGWGDIESKAVDEDATLRALIAEVKRFEKDQAAGKLLDGWSKQLDTDKAVANYVKAQSIGEHEDRGTEVMTVAARMKVLHDATKAITLPTGIVELDVGLDGGLTRGNVGLIAAGSGDGKCLAIDTPVIMADGTVKLSQDIRVGDALAGYSGTRRVLSVCSGRAPMYEVRPTKGDVWRCNGDHILTLVRSSTGLNGDGTPSPIRRAGQVIDVPVSEWLGWSAKRKAQFKQFASSGVDFEGGKDVGQLTVDPHFLGVLLGDGCLRGGTPSLCTPEPELVEEAWEQATARGLRVSVSCEGKTAPTYRISGRRGRREPNALQGELNALGVWGKGPGDKFIPAEYKTGTREVRAGILAGLLDTDGHAAAHNGYDWISKSRKLADDVCFVARSLGIKAQMKPCEKRCQTGGGGVYYRVSLYGQGVVGLPLIVPRKRIGLRSQVKNALRTGFDIVSVGHGAYYGFTLDGDGRFLLGDFTVTHNSSLLSQIHAYCAGALRRVSAIASVELRERQNILKFESALWGIPINVIKANPELVDARYEAKGDKVAPFFFRHFELKSGRPTVGGVIDWIDDCEQRQGVKVDLVGMDHFDRFDPTSAGSAKLSDYGKAEAVYDEIARWVFDSQRWCWIPSQCVRKKSGLLWGPGDMAHSQHKEKRADACLTVTAGGKPGKRTVTIWLYKNREGDANIIIGPKPPGFACGSAIEVPILADVDDTYKALLEDDA